MTKPVARKLALTLETIASLTLASVRVLGESELGRARGGNGPLKTCCTICGSTC